MQDHLMTDYEDLLVAEALGQEAWMKFDLFGIKPHCPFLYFSNTLAAAWRRGWNKG
jgi:hypothetical protein